MTDAEVEKKIVSLLYNRFNKWWNNQKIDVPPFKRRDFKYLWSKLGQDKAITLIGPRQVGKTTLVMQLISSLISERGIPPKRILYVQLDDTELRLLLAKENLLSEILAIYQKYVLFEDLNMAQEGVYLFFDEVQRLPDWADHVKSLLAANKKVHILSTGSASFAISQKSRETLPGRQELYTMLPLKFIDAFLLSRQLSSQSRKGRMLLVGDTLMSTDNKYAVRLEDLILDDHEMKARLAFFEPKGKETTRVIMRAGQTVELTPSGKSYLLKLYGLSRRANDSIYAEMEFIEAQFEPEKFTSLSYGLRKKFQEALGKKSFEEFASYCQKIYVETAPYEADLRSGVERYLSRGGYPEIVTKENASDCQRLIRGYANDVILKDMMPWFNIRDFDTAEKLLFLLASISGEKLNVSSIHERLSGSNPVTLHKYIRYLQNLFLVRLVDFYSGSKLGSSKQPKVYFLDSGFRNALLGIMDAQQQKSEHGHAVESIVCDHLLRLSHKINDSCIDNLSCYGGKREVDFILALPKYSMELPIEVKFRKNISQADLRGLKEFMDGNQKAPIAIVITEQALELREGMFMMPLWMFLIMC